MEKDYKIIILSGKAGAGKNETANVIKNYYTKNNKKTVIIAYADYLKLYANKIINYDLKEEDKPRDFLQDIGLSIKEKNNKFLINRIIEDIKIYLNYVDRIIISDARFIEEIEDIKNNFNNVISINIYGRNNNLSEKQKNHITEISLDNYNKFDFKINNNCNLDELNDKIEKVINEVEE